MVLSTSFSWVQVWLMPFMSFLATKIECWMCMTNYLWWERRSWKGDVSLAFPWPIPDISICKCNKVGGIVLQTPAFASVCGLNQNMSISNSKWLDPQWTHNGKLLGPPKTNAFNHFFAFVISPGIDRKTVSTVWSASFFCTSVLPSFISQISEQYVCPTQCFLLNTTSFSKTHQPVGMRELVIQAQ